MSEDLLWRQLQADLDRQVSTFRGAAGLCVRDLTTDREIALHGDEVFPTASTIKIAILARLMQRAEAGEVDLARRVRIDEAVRVPGSGILTYLDDAEDLTVRDIAVLMIIVSDNTATNLCIDWATIEGTNTMLRRLGLHKTTLRRKMQDFEAVMRGDENVASPAELVQLMSALYRADGLSRFVCDATLAILKKPKHGYLAPGLPQDVVLANKPGGMDRVRCDAGIVYLRRRPYAIAVMTKYGPPDRTVQERAVVEISRTVYEYLSTLDVTNPYGLGVPADRLG
jgi:beta-lactamase class A